MEIDRLILKLGQIARFSSNMVLDEMLSAKCRLPFWIFLIVQHEERPLYHVLKGFLVELFLKLTEA